MSNEALAEVQLLENLKGHRLGPYMSFNPVNSTQIWQWCSAMGEKNPTYQPGEQQMAPPAMMQMWTMRNIDDQYAPGSTSAAPYQVFDEMKVMGYPENVAVSYDLNFHRYLQNGEQAKHYTTIVNISDKKTTGLGVGFFVTERVEYLTLDEEVFAEALITYFQYRAEERKNSGDSKPSAAGESAGKPQWPPSTGHRYRQPDFTTMDPALISVGESLPELQLPITHKLIVGGAIASQDFIPMHHNLPAAKAAGMADIFMNILTTGGLLARYLGDWAGSCSRLKQLKFNLMAPNFPGDTMVMGGEVSAVEMLSDGAEVRVSFVGMNGLGYHTKGSASILLPLAKTTK